MPKYQKEKITLKRITDGLKRWNNIIFSVFLFGIACSGDSVSPDMGFNYFPLQVGVYSIYEVEETNITNNIPSITSYSLRTSVTDSLVENGSTTYFILREKLNELNNKWEPIGTWTAKLNNNQLIQNEDNITFVKLTFPPSVGLKWNGNEYNNLPDNGNLWNEAESDHYYISEKSNSYILSNGYQASSSITVVQNNVDDEIIGKDMRKEVYEKNVGLIYKEIIQLEYCTSTNCIGQQKVNNGVVIYQSLAEHGKK
jgi:hypothetical protein